MSLLQQQLRSFEAETSLKQLVVYVAKSKDGEAPTLEAVGHWPNISQVLPPVEKDVELSSPSHQRRWYPLQEGDILLGVLRAEGSSSFFRWPGELDQRLQAAAGILTFSLSLEIENSKLIDELSQQREQIGLMVHQLRNPLTALRTYAQLLLRRLGPESNHRNLVEGLLTEQAQLNSYISALDQISQPRLPSQPVKSGPLLLPPVLSEASDLTVRALLVPLIDRAATTATLQGRQWKGPSWWPSWTDQQLFKGEGAIAEIVANLLENAFRYSRPTSPVGLVFQDQGLCVWDGGTTISLEERERIFNKGFRGSNSDDFSGSGLGLALARQIAEKLGGTLVLLFPPMKIDPNLPKEGNAFVLTLPRQAKQIKEA